MVSNMLRLVLCLSVFSSLHLTSSAQGCKDFLIPHHEIYTHCKNLPQLNSFLHWAYSNDTGELNIQFTHTGIPPSRLVAWAINANHTIQPAMIGAQALVAIPQYHNGKPKVYTSSISSYDTHLERKKIIYPHSDLRVTYENEKVMTIVATLTIQKGLKSIVHLWQDGPLLGYVPQKHEQVYAHFHSKEVLDLDEAS